MAHVQVVEHIAAPAKQVWDVLTDFGGVKVGGHIEAFEVEGQGVGAVRTITFASGQVVERVDVYDEDSWTFTYSIANADSPQPVSSYSSTIVLAEDDENSCTVTWTATFEPKGMDESDVVEHFRNIYSGKLKQTSQALA